jgi:hypothetical protein
MAVALGDALEGGGGAQQAPSLALQRARAAQAAALRACDGLALRASAAAAAAAAEARRRGQGEEDAASRIRDERGAALAASADALRARLSAGR